MVYDGISCLLVFVVGTPIHLLSPFAQYNPLQTPNDPPSQADCLPVAQVQLKQWAPEQTFGAVSLNRMCFGAVSLQVQVLS